MTTVDLPAATFEDTVGADGIVLVDWWASWCGPCRASPPVFEAASEQHPDVTFAKVDTEAQQGLAQAAGIMSIPTLMIFRDGVPLFSQPGALIKSEITKTSERFLIAFNPLLNNGDRSVIDPCF